MFKKLLVVIISTILLLFAIAYFSAPEDNKNVPSNLQMADSIKLIRINNTEIRVDIADEPQEQAQGLSGKDPLADDQGMLFVFPSSYIPSFWMKEMRFSLDMIWIDANGKIVEITKNISPDTFPKTFSPSSPAKYVLEVNAGWSDANKIKVGDLMTGL